MRLHDKIDKDINILFMKKQQIKKPRQLPI